MGFASAALSAFGRLLGGLLDGFSMQALRVWSSERRGALPAKLGLRGILKVTLSTAPFERGPAFVAKLQPVRILKSTVGTAHAASLLLRAL